MDEGFYRNKLTGYTKMAFDSLQTKCAGRFIHSTDSLFRHRIELIPNCGHSIDYSLTTPWLKNYKRNPYPHTFLWEDYPMDGQHRLGFYNLHVLQRPKAADGLKDTSGEDRDYYEMDIKDNVIRLSVKKVTYQTVERDPVYGIDLKFAKSYHPTSGGKWKIYLNDQLVDMNRPVTVFINFISLAPADLSLRTGAESPASVKSSCFFSRLACATLIRIASPKEYLL